ncbi:MAG: 3TM-type holin, partial [Alphaproteobacteria bacterium]
RENRQALSVAELAALTKLEQEERRLGGQLERNQNVIDGINRLMRPSAFFGVYGMFVLAVNNTDRFAEIVIALQAVPDMFWYMALAMILFLFPARSVEKWMAQKKPGVSKDEVMKAVNVAKTLKEMRRPEETEIDDLPWLDNRSIAEWQAKSE